jgi:hypothetical protein
LLFALVRYLASILFFINDVVALPIIRSDGGTGLDIVEDKGFQRISGTIQGNMQTNATHSLFDVSSFHGNGNNGFAFSAPAPFAGTLTADEKLIDFDTAGKLFPFVADRTAPELLKPCPGGAITAKAQQFLQVYRIDAGFTGGEPPHGFEPVGDRAFGTVHDRSGRQRMLVFALGADIQVS